MDQIRTCDTYPTLKCNCLPGFCLREKLDKEAEAARIAEDQRLNDLVDFQIHLKNEGYITDHDWDWEEEAKTFLKQR